MKPFVLFISLFILTKLNAQHSNAELFKEAFQMLKNQFQCTACQFSAEVKQWNKNLSTIPDREFTVNYELRGNSSFVDFEDLLSVNTEDFKLVAIKDERLFILEENASMPSQYQNPFDIESYFDSQKNELASLKIKKAELDQKIYYTFTYPSGNIAKKFLIVFDSKSLELISLDYYFEESVFSDYPVHTEINFSHKTSLSSFKHLDLSFYLTRVNGKLSPTPLFKSYTVNTQNYESE